MSEDPTPSPEASVSGGYLSLHVPLSPHYENQHVRVYRTSFYLQIPLTGGDQRTTTGEVVIGSLPALQNPTLIGTLTVWSNYEPDTNTLTLCSTDLVSPDSTYLSSYPQSSRNQTCRQHTYLSDAAPCGSNPNWNYCTNLTPGLMQEFQNTVRSAQEAIIQAAKDQGFTVVVRTPPPPVPPETADKLRMVYQEGVFKEAFDPQKDYGEEMAIFDIESTWWGEIFLTAGENFANVIGSTPDPKIDGEYWRALWESQFGVAATCSSFHYPGGNYPCTPPPASLKGGHVILGKTAKKMPKGSDKVFIMPICAKHNADDRTYMAAVEYQKGIALHNYME